MFLPERMKKVSILVLEKDVMTVTEALGELGVIHLTKIKSEGETQSLQTAENDEELATCVEVKNRVYALCEKLGIDVTESVPFTEYKDLGVVSNNVASIEKETKEIVDAVNALDEQERILGDIIDQLRLISGLEVPVEKLDKLSFLHFAIGEMPDVNLPAADEEKPKRAILIPYKGKGEKSKVIAITDKKGRWILNSFLEKYGFEPDENIKGQKGLPEAIIEHARGQLDEIQRKRTQLEDKKTIFLTKYKQLLLSFAKWSRIREELLRAQQNFGKTRLTYVISGFVPADNIDDVYNKILECTNHRTVIEVSDVAMDEFQQTPVKFKHSRILKPFQLLVSAYGFPQYNEIEPTLIIAVSFVLMFAAMFGDVGHGALLLLAGLVIRKWSKKDKVKDFGAIAAYCGAASVVFGFLYGSVFGIENMLPALWLRPMDNIMLLFGYAILFGTIMLSTGLVLNIINHLRQRDYKNALFDKFALAGLIFYWGVLGLFAQAMAFGTSTVALWEIIVFVGIPLVVIIFKEPLYNIITRKKKLFPHGVPNGVLESMVDLLETFLSYLTNTISFIRIAAFALAHVGLMLAVFELEHMVENVPGGVVWAGLIILLGNILILGLEGLIVTIQTMRLEYYEFFGKFFRGGGKKFEPFQTK